jgi:hypothetical protein
MQKGASPGAGDVAVRPIYSCNQWLIGAFWVTPISSFSKSGGGSIDLCRSLGYSRPEKARRNYG